MTPEQFAALADRACRGTALTPEEGAALRAGIAGLQQQLAALHQGEEPYNDERIVPTSGQWIWQWNRATPEQRLAKAAYILEQQERLNHYTWTERIQLHERADAAEWRARNADRYRAAWQSARRRATHITAALDHIIGIPAVAEYLSTLTDDETAECRDETDKALKRGPRIPLSDEDISDRLPDQNGHLTARKVDILRDPSEQEMRARVREIIAPALPVQQTGACLDWCADGHMYDGACLVDPQCEPIVVGQSSDPRHPGWYWSCEGADGRCFGWLSLGHPTAAAARRAYDRHMKRDHPEPAP